MSLKYWDRRVDSNNEEAPLSRRRFLASTTAGVASALVTTQATADTLADVPPREVGAVLSGPGERSKFVHLATLPEAGPGMRNVDPSNAINSKAPLGKLVGTITPTDLHYERSHSGNPDLDPAKHRLLVHGMTRKQLAFTVDDLMRMPSITRTVFIECTGNGWENWKKADPDVTVQNTHGLVSTNEWTGVPLRFLIDLVGKDRRSTWMLAEGADAAGVHRLRPERRAVAAGPRLSDPSHHAGPRRQSEHQMAAPPEIRRPALDDAVGNGPLHAAPGERQGHAIPTQDGDEFRHHIALGNDGGTPRLSAHHGSR